jgi:2-dehydropantoate 2-reductase
MDKSSKICIIGPGAIGGVVAALLTWEGFDVQLVAKYPDLADKISRQGIHVKGNCGNLTVKVPSVALPEELVDDFDYVLIATKVDGLVEVAEKILPFLHNKSRVVSMQNGICEEMLAGVVGEERTIGCVVGFGGTMHEPGRVEMTSSGELVIGNWNRGPDPLLEQLAEILNHVAETRISNDIFNELYSKLIVNACTTTLGAVSGLYLGEMLASRLSRNLFIEITREALAVADAMGITVPQAVGGKLNFYNFMASGPFSGFKRHLTIRVIGLKYRRLKSASLQSLERGRKTEVDQYNGFITRKGKELGVDTPVNEQLNQMVKEIEAGKRSVTPDNFREITYGLTTTTHSSS